MVPVVVCPPAIGLMEAAFDSAITMKKTPKAINTAADTKLATLAALGESGVRCPIPNRPALVPNVTSTTAIAVRQNTPLESTSGPAWSESSKRFSCLP